ncbi:hypothetical protein KJ765_02680 [Candidatus Micrarchaeota archaeon]|nr:hypothetical protein [Candidatus Micrarchaeota archaeon]
MDATFRNLEEGAFRKFKAKCAEESIPLGKALSALMAAWSDGHVRLKPQGKTPARSAHKTVRTHHLNDLGNHIMVLHQWNALSHHSKHHKHRKKR